MERFWIDKLIQSVDFLVNHKNLFTHHEVPAENNGFTAVYYLNGFNGNKCFDVVKDKGLLKKMWLICIPYNGFIEFMKCFLSQG